MPKGAKIDAQALKARRLEGWRLLQEEGLPQAEVARRLKVSRQSVSRWAGASAQALGRVRRSGRKSRLEEAERAGLRAALVAGARKAGYPNELWTLRRVREFIARQYGHRFSTVHVWRLLRQLGFTPQRPASRASERDEAAIARWKTDEWPRLKKKPAGSGARSCSSTKAG